MFRLKLLLFSLMIALFTPLITAQDDVLFHTLTVEDVERTYHLTLPDSTDDPVPLVVALHPAASSGNAMRALSGLDVAAERGFAVVYPNSDGFFWNDGRVDVPNNPLQLTDADDAGFIMALIDELVETHNIDPDRVYLTGQSAGGTMAYKLACTMPERFAAVALVSTLMWDYHRDQCPDEAPAPVNILIAHGTRDLVYPVQGRDFNPSASTTTFTLQDTVNYWIDRNDCEVEGFVEVGSGATIFDTCAEGTSVALYIMPGIAHNWPRISEGRVDDFAIDATQMLLDYFAGEDDWAPEPVSFELIDENGQNVPPRTYRAYVPTTYNPDDPMPLVIVLHGRPDSGFGIAYITDMNPVAEEEGFIAVYPDGLDMSWNYYYGISTAIQKDYVGDDGQFLRDLIVELSQDLNIDQSRIYVTGFSNGGFMTQYLACAEADQFAAFAVVGATFYPGLDRLCEDTPPQPILFMHGTEDVSIRWDGTRAPGGTHLSAFPVSQSLGWWATRNGCELQSEIEELPVSGDSPGSQVFYNTFPNCDEGAELIFYYVLGGGHNWPGVPGRISEEIAGLVNMDINASEEIWAFFEGYTREVDE